MMERKYGRKFVTYVMLIILLLSMQTCFVYADTSVQEEIPDTAKTTEIVKTQNGELYLVDAEKTVKETNLTVDGSRYCQTIDYDISSLRPIFPSEHIRTGASIKATTGPKSEYDSTSSFIARLTVNYDVKTVNSIKYYLVKSVSGGYTIEDLQVTIQEHFLTVSCLGANTSGGFVSNQHSTKYPSTGSFSYSFIFSSYVRNTDNSFPIAHTTN